MVSQDKLRVGSVIQGRYELRRMLGQGGMGSVWAAWHRGLKTEVALKFIDAPNGNQRDLISRFATEAEAVGRIKSQHVVTILDHGYDEALRMPFLAMELLQGENLLDRITRLQRLSLVQTVEILRQALRGLAKAHAAQVIHRDLKPDNIFLCEDDELLVKLIDFGVARMGIANDESSLRRTRTGVLIGTPLYMSPEQARGNKSVDLRSDLYSMGVVAYHCLAGRPPFLSEGFGDLILMIISEQPRPLNSFALDTPPSIQRWLERALAKSPTTRFQTAKEMSQSLVAAYEEAAGSRPWPSSPDVTAGFPALSAPQSAEIQRNSSPDLPTTKISASEILKGASVNGVPLSAAVLASQVPATNSAAPPPKAISSAGSIKAVTMPGEKEDPVDEMTALMPRTRVLLQQPPSTANPYDTPVSESEPMPILGMTPRAAASPPAGPQPASPPTRQPPTWAIVAGISLATVAMGLLGWSLAHHSSDPTEPASSASATPAAHKIALNLRATPPEAVLFLDDERLDNPCALIRPTDTAPHSLRVEAPGYTTKTRVLSFEGDISLALDLDRSTPSPDASKDSPRDPKAPRDSDRKPPKRDPPVRLDPQSPWKK